MTKVLKEAETRDIQSVYTFVRVDNKVHFYVLDGYISKLDCESIRSSPRDGFGVLGTLDFWD